MSMSLISDIPVIEKELRTQFLFSKCKVENGKLKCEVWEDAVKAYPHGRIRAEDIIRQNITAKSVTDCVKKGVSIDDVRRIVCTSSIKE